MKTIFDKLNKSWNINGDTHSYKREISYLINQLYIKDYFEDIVIVSQRILDLAFKFSICKVRHNDALIGSELVLKELTELHGINKIFVCNQDFVHPQNSASYKDAIRTLGLWCEIIRYDENKSLEPIELIHRGQRFRVNNRLVEAYQIIENWEKVGRWKKLIKIAKLILQDYKKKKSIFEYICDLFGDLCDIFIFYIDLDMPLNLERFVKLVIQENKLKEIQIPDRIDAHPQNIILFDLALDFIEQWSILKYPPIIERNKLGMLVNNHIIEDNCSEEEDIATILLIWSELDSTDFNYKMLINDLNMLLLDKDGDLRRGWDNFNLTKHLIANMMAYNEIKSRWFVELESYERFLRLVSKEFDLQLNLAETLGYYFINDEEQYLISVKKMKSICKYS
ncbi:hypothetical protein [Candidatus Epulonipiscium viviparus]|uniref:hypothetical protein n=1 Tax=Candidatus Epulonipiscium viviparus TaxID=420336 RepID=UPI00031D52C6|nr:hypothetical protein [Candidatus Epulopiscium viviparus]